MIYRTIFVPLYELLFTVVNVQITRVARDMLEEKYIGFKV